MSKPPSPLPSPQRCRDFLVHLSATGSQSEAARRSGMALEQATDLYITNTGFSEAWEAAEQAAVEALENEVRRRAFEVIERPLFRHHHPVLNPDGTPVTVRRYNDRMMMLMLKIIDHR